MTKSRMIGEATDVHSVEVGDYIKVGGGYHEIATIEFKRKHDRVRNWNITTTGGEVFNMLEIAAYFKAAPPMDRFHEVWWIYSPTEHEWGGVRLAHFRKSANDVLIVYITGEVDPRRVGPRIWDDIKHREGWIKVRQIDIPDGAEIAAAIGKPS